MAGAGVGGRAGLRGGGGAGPGRRVVSRRRVRDVERHGQPRVDHEQVVPSCRQRRDVLLQHLVLLPQLVQTVQQRRDCKSTTDGFQNGTVQALKARHQVLLAKAMGCVPKNSCPCGVSLLTKFHAQLVFRQQ